MKKNLITIILGALFVVIGIAIFLYPAISNYFASKEHIKVIENYDTSLSEMEKAKIEKMWQEAKIYNENLAGDPVHDPFVLGSGYVLPENYKEVLNVDGTMCTIEIPKINLKLPVYHGTSEDVLENGIGHLEVTALPIGGKGNHAVLTGHRGLPSAELFTRLDEIEKDDKFFIHVLDEIHAYEVTKIEVIEPEKLDELVPVRDKDLITLVTCTPYSVNTHRLLIRGERVPYISKDEKKEQEANFSKSWYEYIIYYLIGIIIVGILIVFLYFKYKKNESFA